MDERATDETGLGRLLGPDELTEVLRRAKREGWRELSLAEGAPESIRVPPDRHFRLRKPLRTHVYLLAEITTLATLNLSSNQISAAGAQALAFLTALTSLHLLSNQIGDAGARALASLKTLTTLNLSNNQVGDEGARALASLTTLTALGLSNNRIGDAGARALTSLTALTTLNLSNNQIGDAGTRALASLTALTTLNLSNNQVSDKGARALVALTTLTALGLSNNRIGDAGARALASLTALTTLNLSYNQISDEGTLTLASLVGLTMLDLSSNRIGDAGARALASLGTLTALNLSNNRIGDEGARALAFLTNLTTLNLSSNRIGDVGLSAILEAQLNARPNRLRRLVFDGNLWITILPPEVLKTHDAQVILAAYQRYRASRQRATLRPLHEAKVLVVGNEAVGKTSLIRALVKHEARDSNEQKTPGAAIHECITVESWSPPHATTPLRLHVWDFGGQEILRGTHRFFLTARSLYLLVLEDRREDDRSIYEWLEIIAQYGGASPVLVVVNKSDGLTANLQLDETALRRAHPAIVGILRTSCNGDDAARASIAALRQTIVTTILESERLKHVRDPMPLAWLRVKNVIAALSRERSVLPVREFEQQCATLAPAPTDAMPPEPITNPDEQRALLGLLHDLGVVVAHGLRRDATAAMREVTILDPNWLTHAIYAVLHSPRVRDQGGEFGPDDLGVLLAPDRYPVRWHELILGMMQEPVLGLCFPIAGQHPPRYLIPAALPAAEPDTGVWSADALRFRYKYGLLPTGLLPRFIVESHRSLTDRPTRWRQGVILGAEGCRILVRGEAALNRVEVFVDGAEGKRAALSVVRNYFDAVHRQYASPGVEARVPLPDDPEVDVGYDHLRSLEREEGPEHAFRPERARRKYTVRELLEGVRREPTFLRHYAPSDEAPMEPDDAHISTPVPPPARSRYHGQVDFGILTMREDENEAVLRRFEKVTTERGRRHYRLRRLALDTGGEYTLAVLRCEQGNTAAQAAAHAMLDELAPRFLLVVGIAGAVPANEFTLGDVVVSTRIVDFSVEAVLQDKAPEYALGGGPLHPDAESLANDIRGMIVDQELGDWNTRDALTKDRPAVDLDAARFYGDEKWQSSTRKKIARHFEGPPRAPLATTGAIASSDRLVKDTERLSVWTKIARQIVAVEMESAGIYRAAHERHVPFLAIRGISDVVGFDRDPDWTAYACETAAAFTKAFLRNRPIEPIARK